LAAVGVAAEYEADAGIGDAFNVIGVMAEEDRGFGLPGIG